MVYGHVRSTDPDKRPGSARLRACWAAACAAVSSRLRAERGSVLVEVLVGSIVLAIATVGILNGMDGAEGIGAKNKARSVQATLAQQDIERMRSMPVSSLDGYTQTRTVNVAGADYTVVSRTDWVSDKAGVVTCSDTRAQAEYLKLTSSVTSRATGSTPVTQTGLLTPTVGQLSTSTGTATVQLTGVSGAPLSGVTVTLSGASSQSATTNALGCAVFGYIATGTYNVTVSGRVAMASSSPATSVMQVYPGRASFLPMQVDRPATVRANFVAPSGNSTIAASAVIWDRITVKNANLTGGEKVFIRTAGKATSVDAPDLYPFLDGVGVYAGDCDANDPSLYSANYFNPSATRGWTALSPGDALRAVNVEMPTLRVTVRRATTNTNFVEAKVKLTPIDSGCTVTGTTSVTFTPAAASRTLDIAVPFGRYTVCVSTRTNSTSSSSARRNASAATVDLRTPVPPTANRVHSTSLVSGTSTTGDCF